MKIQHILTTAAALTLLSTSAFATPWSFGVLGDTQWSGTDPTGNNVNSVAVNQIRAVNQQLIAAGVDFVIQVGDLGDNGTNASLQTRLNENASLTTAGIEFYGLRGNHEASSTAQTFFQQNYIPTTTASATVNVAPDATSYSVTYNNTKLVLLDINTSTNTTTLSTDTTWMAGQLSANDHQQAFVFTHKNMLGQNHKDNEFGGSNDANPTLQNAFFKALSDNNVKYAISGHDHMHHRSNVTSPDGQSTVQEVICASDSYKYYTPSTPYSTRETPIAQQLSKTGYYIYTVDGPRVTAKYYSTTPLANGDVSANPVWTLEETFGYSLNGKSKVVGAGQSYAMTDNTDVAKTMESGFVGTAMAITNGVNSSTTTTYDGRTLSKEISTAWLAKEAGTLSDVLSLEGMDQIGALNSDHFTLSLTVDVSALSLLQLQSGEVFLATKNVDGAWVNAILLDHGINAGHFVFGAASDSDPLGTYGIDISEGTDKATVWAVVDHNSEFAAVPEPSTYVFIGSGLAVLLGLRRRFKDTI